MENKYQIPYIIKEECNDSLYAELKLNYECQYESLKKGKVIYRDNENNKMLFIIKGRLKLIIANSLGAEKITFYYPEKTFCSPYLPELSNVLNLKLIVDEDCELACFDRDQFIKYMISNKGMFEEFAAGIGKRLAILYSNMLDMQNETSKNRVFNFIYQMALNNNMETEGGYLINNFPSVNDISLITGVHKRNIYKYIQEIEAADIIHKVHHTLLVKDIGKLEKLIEEGSRS